VYKNLEKEITKLADEIHFSDDQLAVYSVRIADILFRISTEIESLIKDIYREEIGIEPENVGRALVIIDKLWALKEKIVVISATNMYFEEESNRIFLPFNYLKNDSNDYYSAYCAVKHDRVKNISKANIRAIIRALAALFVLNLYYKDDNEVFGIEKGSLGIIDRKKFDITRGSDIFSINVEFVPFPSMKPQNDDVQYSGTNFTKSVYLEIIDETTREREWKRTSNNLIKWVAKINSIIEENKTPFDYDIFKGKTIYFIAKEVGGEDFASKVLLETTPNFHAIQSVVVLNKGQRIY